MEPVQPQLGTAKAGVECSFWGAWATRAALNGHRSSCSPTCIQTSVPGRSVITKSFGELILMNDKKISSKGQRTKEGKQDALG